MNKIKIISDKNRNSIRIKKSLSKITQNSKLRKSDISIVIGGDGFMLQTLKKNKNSKKIFYGINSGNYGFLMNKFSSKNVIKNLSKAKMISISPLEMTVTNSGNLKKKKIKDIADDKVTKKKGEKICFKTHVIWSQGSPDHHVIKDVGDLYLTNKRIIFLGQIKSYSVNFTRITNFENGDNYIQIQKTAGTNDIYQLYSKASANYAYFIYNKFNK